MKKKRRMNKKRILVIVLLIMFIRVAYGVQKVSSTNNNGKVKDMNEVATSITSGIAQNTEFGRDKAKKVNLDLILVNKKNKLKKDECPEDLTTPDVKFISNADPQVKKMQREAAQSLKNLFTAAENENVTLLGVSGYRNYSYQERLYNNKVNNSGRAEADKYVAQPGASEHQTGLAMDVLSSEYKKLDEGFANTKACNWLKGNSYKHGFIIRYPKEKENVTGYSYEPWHIRYVGNEAAKEIHEKDITLEEYLS